MTPEQALDDLAALMKSSSVAALIGAGASIDAKLPNWSKLLGELCEKMERIPGIEPTLIESCKRLHGDRSKWLILASLLRRHLGTAFEEYIDDRFCDPTLEPTEIHKAVASLAFRFIATLNYDDLLESAYSELYLGKRRIDPITYDKPGDVASYYYKGTPFVLYCHGRAKTDSRRVILSDGDYRSLIQTQVGYQSILQTLFTTTSFIFVGTSLGDPDIQLLLGFLHSAFHGKTPAHYALVPRSEKESAESNQLYHDFKLNIVALDDANFGNNVVKFLTELKSMCV